MPASTTVAETRRIAFGMFHRRLVLLALVVLVVVAVLSLQVMRLTVVEGDTRRAIAEASLDRVTYLPTYRGRIIDRRGNVLARDRASYELAISYDVITGDWSRQQARLLARKEAGREPWSRMSRWDRQRLTNQHVATFEAERQQLFTTICLLGDIDRVELDQRLDKIKRRVESMAAIVHDQQRQKAFKAYGGDGSSFKFNPRPIFEQEAAHTVLTNLRDAVALEFNRMARERDGILEVRDTRRREYPWKRVEVEVDRSTLPRPLASNERARLPVVGVADHVLGRVRIGARDEDIRRHPFRDLRDGSVSLAGYRPVGDEVGISGLESAFESHLRGKWGRVIEHVDTGDEDRTTPEPGRDLQITLDLMLQARIQAILDPSIGLTRVQPWHQNPALPVGTALLSSVVVIEVESGEVLALVCKPTMADAELMSDDDVKRTSPWINRATEAVYPPGSIIKPLVLIAAAKDALHDLHDPIECTGHYFAQDKSAARCWIYREKWNMQTHGPLFANEAIAKSCNIFFYTLADRLGIDRLLYWYERFGLGEPLDIGLLAPALYTDDEGKIRERFVGESGGYLPTEAHIQEMADKQYLNFTSVILGIGQGPVTWTPLQAANAYATIARGGVTRDATLIPYAGHREGRSREDIPMSRELTNITLDGLRLAVTEGTGHRIVYGDGDEERILRAPGVSTWAKTGTAQSPPYPLGDVDGDGKIDYSRESVEVIHDLDHSWFVGLVGPRDTDVPMYAIAVIVEYGGSGGRVAGPIADQVIRALQAERYLPDS
ncbi:MAG: penicillin-binding transpeptidase domain-containing protein [Planctomycetota bacterium]